MQRELIEDMIKTGECRDIDLENTIVNRVFGGVLWNKVPPPPLFSSPVAGLMPR
jgi:ubiquitin carboxyl-terminal hydrolase 3